MSTIIAAKLKLLLLASNYVLDQNFIFPLKIKINK